MPWYKGPLMDSLSPYSKEKAPLLFLVILGIFMGLYLVFSFLLHLVIKRKRWTNRTRLLLSFILFISIFVLVESSLRLYIKKKSITHFRPHPLLVWQLRPNLKDFQNYVDKEHFSTNSLGLRCKEIPFRKTAYDFRILVLGDSSNFGHGVSDNEVWVYLLEDMLKETFKDRNIQVINGACPGYTTEQGLIFLKRVGLKFKPDVLLVGFNNDFTEDSITDKERVNRNGFILAIETMLYKSDFYLLLRQFLFTFFSKALKPKVTGAPLVSRVSLQDYERNIRTFIDIAGEHNIRLIFMNMPINRSIPVDIQRRFFNSLYPFIIRKVAGEREISLQDIDALWFSQNESIELFYPGHLFHPSRKGHLNIARQIYEFFLKEKIIY